MLRTGEILGLKSSHIQCGDGQLQALISLGLTKGGKRHGAAESVVLGYEPVVKFLRAWKAFCSPATSLTPSPAKWRALFNSCLERLGKGQEEVHESQEKMRSWGADRTPESRYHRVTRRCGSFEGGVTRKFPFTQGVAG